MFSVVPTLRQMLPHRSQQHSKTLPLVGPTQVRLQILNQVDARQAQFDQSGNDSGIRARIGTSRLISVGGSVDFFVNLGSIRSSKTP